MLRQVTYFGEMLTKVMLTIVTFFERHGQKIQHLHASIHEIGVQGFKSTEAIHGRKAGKVINCENQLYIENVYWDSKNTNETIIWYQNAIVDQPYTQNPLYTFLRSNVCLM